MSQDDRMREKLEVLDGSRAGRRTEAAVRVKDLLPLLQLRDKMKSKPAAAAPTKAEYDALYADVKSLQDRLREIADIIQKAVI